MAPDTTTMRLSLPASLKSWVESQTGRGRYANAGEYVQALIREDRERQTSRAEFLALVDAGLASGPANLSMNEIWEQARALASE